MIDYAIAILQKLQKAFSSGTAKVKVWDGTETLSIDASSRAQVAGTNTPADTNANPADDVGVTAHLQGWNSANTQWRRVNSRQAGADGLSGAVNMLDTMAYLHGHNGTTWDRLRSDTTNGLDVDVTRMPGQVTHEGSISLSMVSGHKQSYNVHLDVQNATGTVGYMLIDLSDTTNWPHTATGHIVIEKIIINVNPSSAYLGDIEIGFLSSVDATDGDFNKIIVIHGERSAVGSTETYDFAGIGLDLETANWFGPVTANDTTWQTDVNLYGPSGATSFPAGAGDLVMKLISTAGNVDIGVSIVYNTVA